MKIFIATLITMVTLQIHAQQVFPNVNSIKGNKEIKVTRFHLNGVEIFKVQDVVFDAKSMELNINLVDNSNKTATAPQIKENTAMNNGGGWQPEKKNLNEMESTILETIRTAALEDCSALHIIKVLNEVIVGVQFDQNIDISSLPKSVKECLQNY